MTTTTLAPAVYTGNVPPGYEPLVWRSKNGKPAPATTTPYLNANALLDNQNNANQQPVTTGFDEIDALFALLISMSALQDVASDDDGTPNLNTTGAMLPMIFASALSGMQSPAVGGTGAVGDSNVGPISGANPAGIAQSVRGQSAASLMSSQNVPMDRGIPTDVCCANFVSACLQKAGLLPASAHTNSVVTLDDTLRARGWRTVGRDQAKPGDVCIIGNDRHHVEIVASNKNGVITLIGSNNTQGGSGPQVVSYDPHSGNRGDVKFLSPP